MFEVLNGESNGEMGERIWPGCIMEFAFVGVRGRSPFISPPPRLLLLPGRLESVDVDDTLSGRERDHIRLVPLLAFVAVLVLVFAVLPFAVWNLLPPPAATLDPEAIGTATACQGDILASLRVSSGAFLRRGNDNGKTVFAYRAMGGRMGNASGIGRIICETWVVGELGAVSSAGAESGGGSNVASRLSQSTRFSAQSFAIGDRPSRTADTASKRG